MDLNPTFGREELLETLSQQSGSRSSNNRQQQQQQQHRRTEETTSSSSSDQQQQQQSQTPQHRSSSSSSTEHQRRQQRAARIQQQQRAAVLQQQQQQNVDDAVRRLGYRLSIQAHGGDYHTTTTSSSGSGGSYHHHTVTSATGSATAGGSGGAGGDGYPSGSGTGSSSASNTVQQQNPPKSAFEYHPNISCFEVVPSVSSTTETGTITTTTVEDDIEDNNDAAVAATDTQPYRTMKVAKMDYHDQGDKQLVGIPPSSKSILRKLTMECKDWFQHWETEEVQRRDQQRNLQRPPPQPQSHLLSTTTSTATLSPHRFAFSQLNIDESNFAFSDANVPLLPFNPQAPRIPYQQPQQQQPSQQPYQRLSHVSGTLNELMAAAAAEQQQQPHDTTSTGMIPKGLLSSVMEGHSDSATSASTQNRQAQQQSAKRHVIGNNNNNNFNNNNNHPLQDQTSQGSQSISTKDTGSHNAPGVTTMMHPSSKRSTSKNKIGGNMIMAAPASTSSSNKARMLEEQQKQLYPRGKCLTIPSEPVSNNGYDNIDGNYIAYENDSISVSRKHIRTIRNNVIANNDKSLQSTKDSKGFHNERIRSATYRIISSAGQGTFAQVFHCVHVQSGKNVAVKIVKNKPAYTRQAAIEIDIFQALQEQSKQQLPTNDAETVPIKKKDYMVNLISYFMHENHLCLVFELLGLNLYEVLKRRQFRGLPLTMVRDIMRQSVEGILELSRKNIVHCDLKPENILFVSNDIITYVDEGNKIRKQQQENRSKPTPPIQSNENLRHSPPVTSTIIPDDTIETAATHPNCKIKLIDFGSACFEGHTAHSYIQSRFYRCPEVLLGLPYDTAIDMWSLGCVAAELFVGLPILPGVHEHDQLVRITEMIAKIPDWMLDQGAKSTKYYMKYVPRPSSETTVPTQPYASLPTERPPSPPVVSTPHWRLKSQKEFIESLSNSEIHKKGGMEKLQKQPGNRYFKRTKLSDILVLHGRSSTGADRDLVPAFIHFLYGILDPDPWKRLTAFQAVQHPFITGEVHTLRSKTDDIELNLKEENQANLILDTFWPSPWDPAICRRKLLNVQKIREKQQAARRTMGGRPYGSFKSQALAPSQRSSSAQQIPINRDENSVQDNQQARENAEPRAIRSSSPPNQISSSDSTSASQQILYATHDRAESSNTNLQFQNGTHEMLRVDTQTLSQSQHLSQSYQTLGQTPTHADFAMALERPGVVPGTYGFGGLASSQSTTASYQQNAGTPTADNQFMSYNSYSMPQGGYPSMTESFGSMGYNQMPSAPNTPSSHLPLTQRDQARVAPNVVGQLPVTSMNPGAITPNQPFVDAQQFALFQQQQQQLAILQQQQQMGMLSSPFQQQQQQHPQLPMQAQQLQPTQFMMQPQQPVMMAAAPNGGFYYVMTSPTGQPIILQPVGTLNQPELYQQNLNPTGMNMNQFGGPQQQMLQQQQMYMQQQAVHPPQHQAPPPQMNVGGYFEPPLPQMNYGPAAPMQPQQYQQHHQQPSQQQQQQYSSRSSRSIPRQSRRSGTSM